MLGREADRRLWPLADNIIGWTLRHIATVTREHDATPVFVALNNVSDPYGNDIPALKDAKPAGFVVFNLLDIWRNRDQSALRIADWDEHPNAAGNRLIADRLFQLMNEHRSELHLGMYSREVSLSIR